MEGRVSGREGGRVRGREVEWGGKRKCNKQAGGETRNNEQRMTMTTSPQRIGILFF